MSKRKLCGVTLKAVSVNDNPTYMHVTTITSTACCQSAVSNVRPLQDQPHTLLHSHHHGYQGAKKLVVATVLWLVASEHTNTASEHTNTAWIAARERLNCLCLH